MARSPSDAPSDTPADKPSNHIPQVTPPFFPPPSLSMSRGVGGKHAKLPLFARVPVAIFPVLFGAMGVVLGWRRAAALIGGEGVAGLVEMVAGAALVLFGFALIGYAVKIARRPSVLLDEVTILPGRTGLSTLVLGIYLAALILAPYGAGVARGALYAGLVLHAGLIVLLIRQFVFGAREQARVTPAWQLSFTGPVVGALAALGLGMPDLAAPLFWGALVSAVVIWAISLDQFRRASVPAPLRPLLLIHLSPAALLGLVALGLGYPMLALCFALLSLALVALFGICARWLTQAGFSAFWSAFTFPVAGTATLALALGAQGTSTTNQIWAVIGALILVAATLITAPILLRLLRMWAKGDLAAKSNAATS